jgi:tRNA(Met) C34 N-acetyltransferase TmcA
MSNKITFDSVDAFLTRRPFRRENMMVIYDESETLHLLLFGNSIAKMKHDGTIYISTQGWETRTTLMRLREVLRRVSPESRLYTKRYVLYFNNKEWNGNFKLINN